MTVFASKLEQEHTKHLLEVLKTEVTDVLKWQCPETSVSDWDNVPLTSVQVTLYLQKHLEQVVVFLKHLTQVESTESLRNFLLDMNASIE